MNKFDFTDFSIDTNRLNLIPLSLEHKHDVFHEFNTSISQYMFPKPADDISETVEFITGSLPGMREGTNMQLVMTLKNTNEFLGLSGLHDVNSVTPVLGLWLKKSAHGNGYGKEAITAIYHWAKENIKFRYLKYSVDKDNIPSIKIPESLGGKVGETKTMKGMAGNTLNLLEYWIY